MKNKFFKITLPLVTLILALSIIALYWFKISSPVSPLTDKIVSFTINKGESVDSVAGRLKQAELVRSKAAFKITVTRLGLTKSIQAGEFQLSPAWSLSRIAESLTLGKDDLKVTIIEGLRREEIASLLDAVFAQEALFFDEQQFIVLTKNLEGYLFPDTYFLTKSTSPAEAVEILTATFEKKLDAKLRSQFQQHGLTLQEAVTFASIVEREARLDQDRPLVAGILIKRFKNDWPLQADATIQYALGYQPVTDSWWKKNLTKADIELDSPYNTYKNLGLPPTPICNPSFASLEAVANQTSSDYWFYLSDLNGTMHYAETIQQHNLNIATYLNR